MPSNVYLCVQKEILHSRYSLRKCYNSLIKCKHFSPLFLWYLRSCFGRLCTVYSYVQLTIYWSANLLFDFSTCPLMLWLPITRPCNTYTVLSQVNADIYKIRLRKWGLRWVKGREGLKSERGLKKQKLLMLRMHKGSLPPVPGSSPPLSAVINYVPGQLQWLWSI